MIESIPMFIIRIFAADAVLALFVSVSAVGQNAPAAARSTTVEAVGDGKADDTAAIQKAVDGGGALRFPRGTYRLARPVVIDLDKTGFISISGDGVARFIMEGAGPAFKFIG